MFSKLLLLTLFLLKCDFIQSARVLSLRENNYRNFIDADIAIYPKCCPLKSALVANHETFNCSTDELKGVSFDIYSNKVVPSLVPDVNRNPMDFMDFCENVQCVDLMLNDDTWQVVRMQDCEISKAFQKVTHFPKCCPNDYAYDPDDHRCVPQDEPVYAFNVGLQVINATLAHCGLDTAIVDFREPFSINYDRSVNVARRRFHYGSYCIDWNVKQGTEMIRACVDSQDACESMGRRCLRKCCPDGQIYFNNKCGLYAEGGFNVANNTRFNSSDLEDAILTTGKNLRYLSTPAHIFYIDETGDFHLWSNKKLEISPPITAPYCAEEMKLTGELKPRMQILLYYQPTKHQQWESIMFYVHVTLLILSCIFLLLTIGCYLYLPEMQNVHGKSILMFCIFMLAGFVTLICGKLVPAEVFNRAICTSIGFAIAFTFLGAFAWMNVICFDMWMAFGTMRVMNVNNRKKDLKKFLTYNLYGWGVPSVILGFALIVYNTNILPYEFVPHLGIKKCSFVKLKNTYDYLLYFVIPQSIMMVINIVLFVKTASYCYKVKNEIQKMRSTIGDSKEAKQRRFQDDKEKLFMLLKLFLVMGIPWTFEAFASYGSIAPNRSSWALIVLEAITDSFNACQGIIIFCIFILKKKVWTSIKARLGIMPTRRVSELSTGITNDESAYGNGNQTRNGYGVGHYNM